MAKKKATEKKPTMSREWINWTVVLALGCVTLGCQATAPSKALEEASAPAEHDWRAAEETFKSHLVQIEVGWTEEQVLDHAGPPDEAGQGTLY